MINLVITIKRVKFGYVTEKVKHYYFFSANIHQSPIIPACKLTGCKSFKDMAIVMAYFFHFVPHKWKRKQLIKYQHFRN